MAVGASSSVRPALAIVGSLWTGYSVVVIAGDSSTKGSAAGSVIGTGGGGWLTMAVLSSATKVC